jgi:hypothetical protein
MFTQRYDKEDRPETPIQKEFDGRLRTELPLMAMDEIPKPAANAKQIVGLVKSGSTVTGYQLSDGSIVSREQGVSLAKDGEIGGVGIAHNKGTEYLKSLPDGTEDNNLNHLPSVKADVESFRTS